MQGGNGGTAIVIHAMFIKKTGGQQHECSG